MVHHIFFSLRTNVVRIFYFKHVFDHSLKPTGYNDPPHRIRMQKMHVEHLAIYLILKSYLKIKNIIFIRLLELVKCKRFKKLF